jgi:hypothetical protein
LDEAAAMAERTAGPGLYGIPTPAAHRFHLPGHSLHPFDSRMKNAQPSE